MFCSRAGLSLQTQEPRLQFCPKAGLPLQNSGNKVAVLLGINRCSSFPLSVAVACSVESLPSNLATPVQYPAGSGILISVLGLGVMTFVCVLSCIDSGGGLDIVLTTHSGRPALVYLSSVLIQRLCTPFRHLTHVHLGCKSRGSKS